MTKLEDHIKPSTGVKRKRGYVAMLAVQPEYRRLGLGRKLIEKSLEKMKSDGANEIVLEAEITNTAALRLYQSFGFIRDKRLLSYYLNGNDAYKLKLFVN